MSITNLQEMYANGEMATPDIYPDRLRFHFEEETF